MTEKYIELNLNDERASKVAQIIGNKTAKKILNLLSEEELSQGDIAKRLKIGLSNVDYNIKNLLAAGLIEKSSSFFWSVKGKKIPTYGLANKKIIISTKNSFKGVLASALLGGIILGGIKLCLNYFNNQSLISNLPSNDLVSESAPVLMTKTSAVSGIGINLPSIFSNVLIFVLAGLVIGCLGYFIYLKMKGGFNK